PTQICTLSLHDALPISPLYEFEVSSTSEGDDATKWLWKARDGALVESVQIRTPDRTTSCLSSQVGCAMGCVFCATGLSGFERHLDRKSTRLNSSHVAIS